MGEYGQQVTVMGDWQGFQPVWKKRRKKMEALWEQIVAFFAGIWASIVGFFGGLFGGNDEE